MKRPTEELKCAKKLLNPSLLFESWSGLKINSCKLTKFELFLYSASEKTSTSKRLQVRKFIRLPNIYKEFSRGLANLLVEKILLAKLCKGTEKLTSSPDSAIFNFSNREVANLTPIKNVSKCVFHLKLRS